MGYVDDTRCKDCEKKLADSIDLIPESPELSRLPDSALNTILVAPHAIEMTENLKWRYRK
jgi:hypothetical protein